MLVVLLPYLLFFGIPAYILFKWYREFKNYKSSTYFHQTKTSYWKVRRDAGMYGEYLTYARLRNYEDEGVKFLFNVYIPKGENETTELDVVLISSRGLFVFESKNYSGWIFGTESQRRWTQTLPQGRGRSNKEHFYNPIMQNQTHIKYLRKIIGSHVPVRSIIVFSERCVLKDVTVHSTDVAVVNRYDVASAVAYFAREMPALQLSKSEISDLYHALYPYTQVTQETKDLHIENIQKHAQ